LSHIVSIWRDNDGNLWKFGGNDDYYELYNDLWKYDGTIGRGCPEVVPQASKAHWCERRQMSKHTISPLKLVDD
jgi:hypothetical protein